MSFRCLETNVPREVRPRIPREGVQGRLGYVGPSRCSKGKVVGGGGEGKRTQYDSGLGRNWFSDTLLVHSGFIPGRVYYVRESGPYPQRTRVLPEN